MTMKYAVQHIAGLKCHILDPDINDFTPQRIFVLCHGFGAPGTDLVGLGEELYAMNPAWGAETRFLFPEAPLDLTPFGMPGGRAWWMIDMQRLTQLQSPDHLREFMTETPPGMLPAAEQLQTVIEQVLSQAMLPASRCILGGFSQGSMVAAQVAFHLKDTPGALCILSGSLINSPDWTQLAMNRTDLPVFQSHGMQDPILPFQGAVWLRDMLKDAGIQAEFHAFTGGHTITLQVLSQLSQFLGRISHRD
ncbi:MAG: alpha/beta hydrolase [Planctomycetaceae bacterium]